MCVRVRAYVHLFCSPFECIKEYTVVYCGSPPRPAEVDSWVLNTCLSVPTFSFQRHYCLCLGFLSQKLKVKQLGGFFSGINVFSVSAKKKCCSLCANNQTHKNKINVSHQLGPSIKTLRLPASSLETRSWHGNQLGKATNSLCKQHGQNTSAANRITWLSLPFVHQSCGMNITIWQFFDNVLRAHCQRRL